MVLHDSTNVPNFLSKFLHCFIITNKDTFRRPHKHSRRLAIYFVLTLLCPKFNSAPPEREISEMKGTTNNNVRFAKQDLFTSNCVLIPTTEKHRLQTVDDTLFRLETINCVRPEMHDTFNDAMGTVNNSAMIVVIDRELEH